MVRCESEHMRTRLEVTNVEDLARSHQTVDGNAASLGAELAMTQYLASASAAWTDYRALVNLCSDAARPLTESLFTHGCRAWLFLVGALLSTERRKRYPDYSLASPARKGDLVGEVYLERTYHEREDRRTAGLYLLDPGKFSDACWFQTLNVWSALVLSTRADMLSGGNLDMFYRAAAFDSTGTPVTALNWLSLADAICPLGDIVVKTLGAFDDKERAIRFVYAPANDLILGRFA
jgi:hypothetical protein